MHIGLSCAVWLCAALVLSKLQVEAGINRTQTIQLRAGWNAVFIEVFPDEQAPAAVFSGTPIEIAASYHAAISSAQFISDPAADLFRQAGWSVWYAPGREDSFLTSLHAIHGQQSYLIYSKHDYVWALSGSVTVAEIRWQAGAFNLVGFGVDEQAPPTFAQFFSGSRAHRHNRLYRLSNGAWRRVTDPEAETMRSGEAFWIYCEGGSRYQGPLQVEVETRQGLVLRSGVKSLILRNRANHPVTPTLEHVAGGDAAVPLSVVVTAVGGEAEPVRPIPVAKPVGDWTQPLPTLEVEGALRVPFQARHADQTAYTHSSLLKVTTDIGTAVWIPVFSIRDDLAEN